MRRVILRYIKSGVLRSRAFKNNEVDRLKSVSVLTIDVFDTLVTRLVYHPTDIFKICGIIMEEKGIVRIGAQRWCEIRSKAEQAMRNTSGQKEVLLSEIYDWLLAHGYLAAEHVDAAIRVELDIERTLSRPIGGTIDCVNRFIADGGTVIAISDTYLPGAEVEILLRQAEVDTEHMSWVTSADRGSTKRSGKLFKLIVSERRSQTGQWLHVGDNLRSDFFRAELAGIRAAPYLSGSPNVLEELLYKGLKDRDPLQSLFAGAARATRLSRSFEDRHAQAVWDISANMTGPLLFSFVAWTLREAVRKKLQRLYFFARDGEILLRVAKILQPQLAPAVECRYLHVSRKSLHLAAVTEFGEPQLEWIFDNIATSSLESFLAKLDITPDDYRAAVGGHGPLAELDAQVRLTGSLQSVVEASVESLAVRALIIERATMRREKCLAYLTQEGVLDPVPIGVVDIGWRGRLQRSLAIIAST